MTMDNQSLLLRSALRHTREEDAITVAERTGKARILVVGTGGGGNNTVNRIMTVGINGAECIAMNTDKKHLDAVKANQKILLGPNQTRGLGAGGFPEIGETAAEESIDEIRTALEGADLIFIAVGLGGGTGTGSAPVIARIAREEIGAIVVGTATMPFTVERARVEKARSGLEKLRQHCDTVVAINNDKLLDLVPNIPVKEAFGTADEILASMVKGITETISTTSLINLDFADVRAVLRGGGVAMVGVGEAQGD
ncbi:MAG: cell division protein FtsZ, partial [Candidatus Ranarchaeia archaeon]